MTSNNDTRKYAQYISIDNIYRFECPNCNIIIEVHKNQINCQIFRCGIMKQNGQQVNQHASKQHCDNLIEKDMVWGCCKPFKFFHENPPYVDTCDYI